MTTSSLYAKLASPLPGRPLLAEGAAADATRLPQSRQGTPAAAEPRLGPVQRVKQTLSAFKHPAAVTPLGGGKRAKGVRRDSENRQALLQLVQPGEKRRPATVSRLQPRVARESDAGPPTPASSVHRESAERGPSKQRSSSRAVTKEEEEEERQLQLALQASIASTAATSAMKLPSSKKTKIPRDNVDDDDDDDYDLQIIETPPPPATLSGSGLPQPPFSRGVPLVELRGERRYAPLDVRICLDGDDPPTTLRFYVHHNGKGVFLSRDTQVAPSLLLMQQNKENGREKHQQRIRNDVLDVQEQQQQRQMNGGSITDQQRIRDNAPDGQQQIRNDAFNGRQQQQLDESGLNKHQQPFKSNHHSSPKDVPVTHQQQGQTDVHSNKHQHGPERQRGEGIFSESEETDNGSNFNDEDDDERELPLSLDDIASHHTPDLSAPRQPESIPPHPLSSSSNNNKRLLSRKALGGSAISSADDSASNSRRPASASQLPRSSADEIVSSFPLVATAEPVQAPAKTPRGRRSAPSSSAKKARLSRAKEDDIEMSSEDEQQQQQLRAEPELRLDAGEPPPAAPVFKVPETRAPPPPPAAFLPEASRVAETQFGARLDAVQHFAPARLAQSPPRREPTPSPQRRERLHRSLFPEEKVNDEQEEEEGEYDSNFEDEADYDFGNFQGAAVEAGHGDGDEDDIVEQTAAAWAVRRASHPPQRKRPSQEETIEILSQEQIGDFETQIPLTRWGEPPRTAQARVQTQTQGGDVSQNVYQYGQDLMRFYDGSGGGNDDERSGHSELMERLQAVAHGANNGGGGSHGDGNGDGVGESDAAARYGQRTTASLRGGAGSRGRGRPGRGGFKKRWAKKKS